MSDISMRQALLEQLDDATTELIEAPLMDGRGNTDQSKMQRALQTVQVVFKAYEDLVILTKEKHNVGFAFKDLPGNELTKYRSVSHKMKLLWSLYGEESK